jgi:hypothetical protein
MSFQELADMLFRTFNPVINRQAGHEERETKLADEDTAVRRIVEMSDKLNERARERENPSSVRP